MVDISNHRTITRVRFETRRRVLTVCRVEPIGTTFRRITLGGSDLEDFRSLAFDDHIKLEFEISKDQYVSRDFTPRRFDPQLRELTVDIALHDSGPAVDWARQAKAGDSLVVLGPRGSMIVPMDFDWHLLAGDTSALPAIARRLEELPAFTRALVVVEMAEDMACSQLRTTDHVDVRMASSSKSWLSMLRELRLPGGEGFIWCAGEAQAMKTARGIFVEQHGHPSNAMRIAAYWKAGTANFHERLTP